MTGLKQMLKNKMDDDRSFATKVSKIAGYANPTGFYKFLNKDESEFKDIQKLIEIVQYAFQDREFDIMDQYIRTLNPNNVLARQALEYANINKLDSLFEFLLDELESCSNAESKEWATVYRIDWNVAKGIIKPLDGIELLNDFNSKYSEMKVFARIAKFYCYQDLKFIDLMFEMSTFIENGLKNIKNEYIYRKYNCRYNILIANVYLHKGNVEKLRDKVNDSISKITNHTLLSLLYHAIGISYLYESYDEANSLLNKALYHAEKGNNNHWACESRRSLNFVNNYWGKEPSHLNPESNHISDIHEMAFYYINRDNKKAITI